MQIQIGKSVDDKRTVTKQFTVTSTLPSVVVKDNCSITDPVLEIVKPSDMGVNYVYVPEWGRYYFINNIEVLTGGRVALHCHVDVLMSYRVSIRQLSCIIDKAENVSNANLYKNDGSFVTLAKTQNQVINFNSGFSDTGSYILMVAGG